MFRINIRQLPFIYEGSFSGNRESDFSIYKVEDATQRI